MKKTPVVLITGKEKNSMVHKVDEVIQVKSYYYFVKAVNHWILSQGSENGLFLRGRVKGFEEYKTRLLSENFETLIQQAGVTSADVITGFAEAYNHEMNAILLFSEKEVSSAASIELFNLAMITGKLGKTSNGLLSLKEKNNSQGLFDMGIQNNPDLKGRLESGNIRNLFIFGEDPAGCAADKEAASKLLDKAGFIMVQDYFMTVTASNADLVLPASFPAETGGSYTNTLKMIQQFEAVLPGKVEMSSVEQLLGLQNAFGLDGHTSSENILKEIISLLPNPEDQQNTMNLQSTGEDDNHRLFNFGCDSVVKYFEEEFTNTTKTMIL
jgi:predicted molibdopterin-dependent oxidoreductase YjgC